MDVVELLLDEGCELEEPDGADFVRPDEASSPSGRFSSRRCPRCGEVLFADMPVCYGCLYDFRRDRAAALASVPMPEGVRIAEELEAPPESSVSPPALAAPLESSVLPPVLAAPPDLASPFRRRVRIGTDSADVTLPLGEKGLVLGADSSCDVVLHSLVAAPRHLCLLPTEEGVLALDLGSEIPATTETGVAVGDGTLLVPGESVAVCGSLVTVA